MLLLFRDSGKGLNSSHAQLIECIRKPFIDRKLCDLINPHCWITFDKTLVYRADIVIFEVDFLDWRRLKTLRSKKQLEANVLHDYLTMVKEQMKSGALLYRVARGRDQSLELTMAVSLAPQIFTSFFSLYKVTSLVLFK